MIPASFKYAAPGSVLEAIDLLRTNEDAKVLAGGHSLLPLMKLRLANPPVLVDINRIPGLDYIREDADRWVGCASAPWLATSTSNAPT